jgi:hypothetical protein
MLSLGKEASKRNYPANWDIFDISSFVFGWIFNGKK